MSGRWPSLPPSIHTKQPDEESLTHYSSTKDLPRNGVRDKGLGCELLEAGNEEW